MLRMIGWFLKVSGPWSQVCSERLLSTAGQDGTDPKPSVAAE